MHLATEQSEEEESVRQPERGGEEEQTLNNREGQEQQQLAKCTNESPNDENLDRNIGEERYSEHNSCNEVNE